MLALSARMVRAGAALVVLAGLAVLGVLGVQPPTARGVDAPPDAFSAARAAEHVRTIGAEVHVAGGPAADRVRAHIVDTLLALDLTVEIQETVGQELEGSGIGGGGEAIGMARVRNVIARVPGTAPTVPLILMAHYDSVQVSYGANDDGAGVSTLLETARALATGPAPRNDIVFLFTDAEEACLCGAEAYVRANPRGGVVLNIEARGSTGPPVTFETSAGNAGLIDVYADAVPHPVATSFAVEIYRILPNDTDFSPFLAQPGYAGLNTAYIDGSAVYHTPYDTADRMNLDSLQAHGDNALALARAFGNADLATLARRDGPDATYFPLFAGLVQYPASLIWPIAALALLAVGALAFLSRRRSLAGAADTGRAGTGQAVTGRALAGGFGLALAPIVLAPVLAQLYWTALVAIRPGWANMIDPWRPEWLRVALLALTVALLLGWYALARRWVGAVPLAIGGLAWLAVIGVAFGAATPGGSYLGALPALAGAAAGLVALAVRNDVLRLAVLTIGAGTSVLILAPTVYLFFPALGLELGAAPALFATMAGLALLPILGEFAEGGARRKRWWASATAGVVAVVLTVTGLVTDTFDADHPEPAQLMYALDTDTGKAWWASTESSPGDWTSQYVSGSEDLTGVFPMLDPGMRTGPAEAASLPAPAVTVVADTTTGGQRHLTLRVRPQREVRVLYLGLLPGSGVTQATVGGRTVDVRDDRFGVLFHALPADGVEVTLISDASKTIQLRTMDGSDGLEDLPGFRPRPADVGVLGSHESELVVVAKTHRL